MFAFATSAHAASSSSSSPSLPSSHRSRASSTPYIQTRVSSHHLKAARQRNRSLPNVLAAVLPRSRVQRTFLRLLFLLGALSVVAWFVASGEAQESWKGVASESRYPVSRAMEAINTAEAAAASPIVRLNIRKRHHLPAINTQIPFSSSPSSSFSSATSPSFTPAQELVALTHFLVSASHGSLPLESYDPITTPLSPEWVLDFDLAAADGPEKMAAFGQEVWENEGKLVVFGSQSDVWTREIMKLFKEDHRVVEVALIDVDARADKEIVRPILNRLLATPSLPIVLLGGHSLGGFPELKALNTDGKLGPMLAAHDVLIAPPKKARRTPPVRAQRR